MPLIINELPKREPKEIRMGKPVADYYPPGATEPIVRPAHIPAPAVPVSEVESKSIKEAATSPPVVETVKKESASTKKATRKK